MAAVGNPPGDQQKKAEAKHPRSHSGHAERSITSLTVKSRINNP